MCKHSQDGTQHSGSEPEEETEMFHILDVFDFYLFFILYA